MKVPLYRQKTEYTCGPASVMMVLKHFKKIKELSEKTEINIWHNTRLFPFFDTYPHGIAAYLSKKGLYVELVREVIKPTVHEFDKLFDMDKIPLYLKKDSFHAFKKNYHKQILFAKKSGVRQVKKKPSLDMIKEYLKKGFVVLALIGADYFYRFDHIPPKHLLAEHWVIVTKVDGVVQINDPYSGRIALSPKEFNHGLKILYKKFKIKPALICVKKR